MACEVMDEPDVLPFKAEQLIESKSFKKGFRGAWFRSKIKSAFKREYSLEFYDFPEEKVRWTRLYQKPDKGSKTNKTELMVRPQYPPIYKESEVPDSNKISEVVAVKTDVWKVGDEVDFFADGCYWFGTVTKILTNEQVQIELPPPPAGEGILTFDVCCKDIRPSLNWSLEHGWSVPIPKGGESLRPCVRLIKPVDKGPGVSEINGDQSERVKDFHSIAGSSSFSSSISSDTSKEATHKPMKRKRSVRGFPLNCTQDDTIEAAVLDLEELVNKVKWLKGLVQRGTPLSDAQRPQWEFLNHSASSTPKRDDAE